MGEPSADELLTSYPQCPFHNEVKFEFGGIRA